MVTAPSPANLRRLLHPAKVAVVGGGSWGRQVIFNHARLGFQGEIAALHPPRDEIAGRPAYRRGGDVPFTPDAAFIGVNRFATVDVARDLAERGCGGLVCFAAGFREASVEDENGARLQDALLEAVGDMALIGPNCYGFINYLDGVVLWPDQQGGQREARGVAIITQSSNIAMNISMQRRGLAIAYNATAGNQAQLSLASLGEAFLKDPRVTALGLHVEGFSDVRAMEQLAATARAEGKGIVALKVGRSAGAQAATFSHTASVAGFDAGAQALLDRLGMARVDTIPALLDTLKLLHTTGPLPAPRIATMSCSGGEAGLMSDLAEAAGVEFPPLNERQRKDLRDALGPMVALANPLDYHTFVWGDTDALAKTFTAMIDPELALTLVILDLPHAERCDPQAWECVVDACLRASEATGGKMGIVSTIPENMHEAFARRLAEAGVVTFSSLEDMLAGVKAGTVIGQGEEKAPVLLAKGADGAADHAPKQVLTEAEAKAVLAQYGLRVPRAARAEGSADIATAGERIGFPLVVKGEGIAHKSDAGAVALNIASVEEAIAAAEDMPTERFLLEEMVGDVVAELLVGVVRDEAHGFVLTIAAGGVLTELLKDSTSLLLPVTPDEVSSALRRLRVDPLLNGYRGRPVASEESIVAAVMALQAYVEAHADQIDEVEINPLIAREYDAVAVDALIRLKG